jgi:hypothetical protein
MAPKTEDFVHLPGAPGYAVTRVGEVWSKKRGEWRKLKPRPCAPKKHKTNLPYLYVALFVDGRRSEKAVHKLVLEAFVGPAPDGLLACHRNGRCQDNRLRNLRWGTSHSNQKDRVRHGTDMRGEKGRGAVVSNAFAAKIRREYGPCRGRGARTDGPTLAALARKYKLNANTVAGIVSGRRYA